MNDRQWRQVWELFRSAKELPDEAREAYLNSTVNDPEIRREVAEMLEEPAEELAEDAPPEQRSKTGTCFGRYQIGELLGSGGMGHVYAAQDTELGRQVAVKFLSPEMISSRVAVQRLVREAKAASALNHPHIVTVYEVAHFGDDTAIAMELVEGEPLRRFCEKPVEAAKVVDWGRQIAQALAAAHQGDIVHRDIKPENVMVRPDGIVKVLDFGLARQAGGLGQSHASALLAGTLKYMAPEQIRGEGATRASDIFALGIVLYELAAGRHPFGGGSVIDTAHTIAHAGMKRPSTWNARLPPGFDPLLLAMLHKDPHKRPSAVEVDRRLRELDVTARPIRWRRIIPASVALAAVLAGVWLFRFRERIFPAKDPAMTQVTTQVHEDQVTAAAIAPDGKSLAFAVLGGAVYVRRMSDGFTKPLNTPAGLRVDRICWFAGQSKLLLSGSQESGEAIEHYQPGVWVMPLSGGDAVKVIDSGRDAEPSPDGARIAFTGADQSAIWVSTVNGKERRQLADGGRSSIFEALIWSPDGRRIGFGRQDYASKADQQPHSNYQVHWNYRYSYQTEEVETGRVTAKIEDLMVTSACALPDGRILFLRPVSIETLPANQIWEMRTDPKTGQLLGSLRQVTHLPAAMLASISSDNDGKDVVATLAGNGYPNIYVADWSPEARSEPHARRLTNIRRLTYTEASDYPHAWTDDSQAVIFESSPNSQFDLFRQRVDRRDREPLVVSKEMKVMAQLAPDRQWLLYHQSAGQGLWKVMRVRPQGGTPEEVLPLAAKVEFRCGLQRSARCVLRTMEGNQYVFYELDAERGRGRELARTALTASIVGDWDVSPDGSQVAIPIHGGDEAPIRLLNLNRAAGAEPEITISLKGLRNLSGVVWAADGRGWFAASRAEHGWILSYADAQGNTSDLLEATGQIFAVPSPDGRHVAFPLWDETSNAWLFRRT